MYTLRTNLYVYLIKSSQPYGKGKRKIKEIKKGRGWEGGLRGDIGICIADLCRCAAETNTTLYSNYAPIKK